MRCEIMIWNNNPLFFSCFYSIIPIRQKGGYNMTNENIKELDNESLVSLLQALEQMDDECKDIINDIEGDCNE